MSDGSHVAMKGAVQIQRSYYANTASRYDDMHGQEGGEHNLGLCFLISVIKCFGVQSALDVGCGTGRALLRMKSEVPNIRAVGVEPSPELRQIGYAKGLSEIELVDGDATNLAFADSSFDLVCEFGALHHIPAPSRAVSEMLRVSRKAVLISDSNNFGQGTWLSRLVKQSINACGLWPIADLIKTRGKGYTISKGDGLAYSYSVFNDYEQIAKACKSVHFLNSNDSGPNLYRTAGHVVLLGVKD